MTATRPSRDAGLTLVELLVVLALTGMLGALVASGLHTASGSLQRMLLRNGENEELLTISRQMRQLLSRISSEKLGSWSNGVTRFEGSRDQIRFFAPLAPRFGAQDVVSYAVEFTEDGKLRIVWQLDRESPSARKTVPPARVEEILEGATDGAFAYFGPTDGQQAQWTDSWRAQERLPQLVRLRFDWRGQTEELIVAPMLTAGPCSIPDSDLPCSN
ncbi:prepilin-type N-terminal cleavage/methylation domain-containing protein [Bradyrhizobium sp. SSUT112]|uniref:prepilin-type N-terminal cleavage/methylation domain-containing protein n=1 Tax=Bradyrhizobium sp. SSUT112 TaxID=3040604 RepID=UPI00244708FA|nr:prepilin-type N-terminal cleavage/methylation domain-containing protein [Bradyrhizobium sp. SSUT112]MDH2352284.1 prepilin-type N-terminal cleavage/methylation domain-containing protein [Bradyrhizobium sp. SSUT112]